MYLFATCNQLEISKVAWPNWRVQRECWASAQLCLPPSSCRASTPVFSSTSTNTTAKEALKAKFKRIKVCTFATPEVAGPSSSSLRQTNKQRLQSWESRSARSRTFCSQPCARTPRASRSSTPGMSSILMSGARSASTLCVFDTKKADKLNQSLPPDCSNIVRVLLNLTAVNVFLYPSSHLD